MLDLIDAQGNVRYYCTWRSSQFTPACGAENTLHISHEAVKWININVVEVPPCVRCGAKMSLRIPTDEEMTPPIVVKDPQSGDAHLTHAPGYEEFHTHWDIRTERVDDKNVVREVVPHSWVAHHQNLARQMQDIGKVYSKKE